MKKTIENLKKWWTILSESTPKHATLVFKPIYRIANIEKNALGDYEVVVQLIGKTTVFKIRPEEILADDKMTDQFSPRDIRTLTYLGYLGINSPKYRILAKKLSETDNRMLFALHKKGEKSLHIKTASEISQDKEILKQIDQQDAHMIGFIAANDTMLQEKLEKEKILVAIEQQSQSPVDDAFSKKT